jgi:hypothetical protein
MLTRRYLKIFISLVVCVACVTAFSYGVAVGHYQIGPYNFLFFLKNKLPSMQAKYLGAQDELLKFAFVDELYLDDGLIYPHGGLFV